MEKNIIYEVYILNLNFYIYLIKKVRIGKIFNYSFYFENRYIYVKYV